VLKLKGKHFIDPKSSEICKVFPCTTGLPFFGQNCSLPFSLRSLDIPALLKSWQKHYKIMSRSENGPSSLFHADGHAMV
jgi:hypothetical protein